MLTPKAQEQRQELTKKFIESIGQGTAPWQEGQVVEAPINGVSERPYTALNMLNLINRANELGTSDNRWYTFDQVRELGDSVEPGEQRPLVKQGAHGVHIEYYERKENDNGFNIKTYVVFNGSQINGIPPYTPKERDPAEIGEKIDRLLNDSGVEIRHGANSPAYNLRENRIELPYKDQFPNINDYYAAAIHTLVESTGHMEKERRSLSHDKDGDKAAREACVCKLAVAMISAEIGIQQPKDHYQGKYSEQQKELLESKPHALSLVVRDAHRAVARVMEHERSRERGQGQAQAQQPVSEQIAWDSVEVGQKVVFQPPEGKPIAGTVKEKDGDKMTIKSGRFNIPVSKDAGVLKAPPQKEIAAAKSKDKSMGIEM